MGARPSGSTPTAMRRCKRSSARTSRPAPSAWLISSRGLGVSVDPAGHGVAEPEWRGIVERAFAGARGKNYIGTRARIES